MKAPLILLMVFLLASNSMAAKASPNVILIMADDLGYNDLSCYGSVTIKTPVLDQLAAEGVRLTSFYSGSTICTPSRMALLTGLYPVRCGWQGGVVGYGIKPQNGLAPATTTIAEIFKQAGYETALIGKWHLGDSTAHSPAVHGFNTTYFINKSNNQTKQLWRGNELIADPFDNRHLTELFTDEAIRFVESNHGKPFFLYLPFSAPHFPAEAHPDWKGKTKLGAYGDVVEELDSRIGDLLKALHRLKIEDNTIVVFLSDNGVEPGQKQWAQSTPYRGLKWSTLEGGNRVPCIIRWPGRIPARQTNNHLISAIDLLPSLTAACQLNSRMVKDTIAKINGVNIMPSLCRRGAGRPARSTLLFWHGWGTPQAIRSGNWKLYFDEIEELPDSQQGPVLINLKNDPAEHTNLSQQNPKRVAELLDEARRQLTEIGGNTMALGGPVDSKAKVPAKPKWLP